MNRPDISYQIKINNERSEQFDFSFQTPAQAEPMDNPPFWTELSYRQCSHCPLSADEHKHCPVALNLYHTVKKLDKTRSIDEVEVKVITEDRTVIQKTAIQRAVASMLEVLYATSGCPKTQWMQPLARFHSPLAAEEETVFRATSMFLLAQYFIQQKQAHNHIKLDGLNTVYDDMHILNTAVASRLQSATQSDSVKNAITLVDMYSTLIPILLEDHLDELRPFFGAFLPKGETEAASSNNYLEKAKAFSLELELEPLDSNNQSAPLPDWLKAKDELVSAAAEPFITSSGLALELAPLDEEAGKKKISGRATFILPDD